MDTSTDGCRNFEAEPRKGEKVDGVYCVCSTENCNYGWVPDDPKTQEGWTTTTTTASTTTTTTTTTAAAVTTGLVDFGG